MFEVRLKPGRDKSLRQRHPWIFSGGLQTPPKDLPPGELCRVCDAKGRPLAIGYGNPRSQIAVRIVSFDPTEKIDRFFWTDKITKAQARRDHLLTAQQTDAYRLIYSEADGLPGLIVDRYGDVLSLQCLTLGMETQLPQIGPLLQELTGCQAIYRPVDKQAIKWEGLTTTTSGWLLGSAPLAREVWQEGRKFHLDLSGQKTGFYLDQRENHTLFGQYCRPGDRILDAFSYSGGFSLAAGKAGCGQITAIDQSHTALKLMEQNLAANHLAKIPWEGLCGDALEILRDLCEAGHQYQMVSLDPPKFASKAGDVARAAKGYNDINRLGLSLVSDGGYLFTYSCSGHISAELLQKIVFSASLDAGVNVEVVRSLRQSRDHPELITVPETFYLKGLLCRIWQR